MSGTTIGALRVIIGGDTKDLDRALRTTEGRLAGFGRNLTGIVAGLGLGAAVASIVAFTKHAWTSIDAQEELAYRIGGTVTAVQALTAVAEKSGLSVENLAKAAGLMNMRLAEAARTGAGPAYEALRRVGLKADELAKLDVDERMAVLADRFQELGLTAGQQAEVLRAFGIRSQEMINVLQGGGDALREARKDAVAFGVALSDIDIRKVTQADDALKDVKQAMTGVANQLAVALAPIVKQLADDFSNASRASGGFRDALQGLVGTAVHVFGAFSNVWQELRLEFDELARDLIDGWNSVFVEWTEALSRLTRGVIPPLQRVEHEFGKLRAEIGSPPSDEYWRDWYKNLVREAEMAAFTLKEINKRIFGGEPAGQDPLTEEQRKQLELKFVQLQKSLANEAAALDFWRQEELLKIKEFNDKQIGSTDERQKVLLALEEKYRTDLSNLIFSKLDEGIATEEEKLIRKYDEQLRLIEEFEEQKGITEARAGELRKGYQEKLNRDLLMLEANKWDKLASIVDTSMSQISQIVGKEGGAAFEIMKAISMATALIHGYRAVIAAWNAGWEIGGPAAPALAATFAGIAAAGAAAQIAAIASAKPGSGSGSVAAPSAGGASSAAAAAGAAQAGGGSTLTVRGIDASSLYSGEMVRDLSQRLLQFQRDGGTVVLA